MLQGLVDREFTEFTSTLQRINKMLQAIKTKDK